MIVSEKITSIEIYQIISSFFFKDLNIIKQGLFLVKKLENQVIKTMIMLPRSSERIFNQSRCTGNSVFECSLPTNFIIHRILEYFHRIDAFSLQLL